MPRFICFQRSVISDRTPPSASEEAAKGDFEAQFSSWMELYGDQLVDVGGPFGAAALALPDGASSDATPSLTASAGGYMIISANDLEAALEAARAFPGLVRPGSGTEVVEIREPAG